MTEAKEDGRLLSISEAASQLGVSTNTLRRWADRGLIKVVRLPSGYRRFTPAEVRRLHHEMGLGSVQGESV